MGVTVSQSSLFEMVKPIGNGLPAFQSWKYEVSTDSPTKPRLEMMVGATPIEASTWKRTSA